MKTRTYLLPGASLALSIFVGACSSSTSTVLSPADGGGGDALAPDGGGLSCAQVGGSCIAVAPSTSCPAGTEINSSYDCGGVGATCCAPQPPKCAQMGGRCVNPLLASPQETCQPGTETQTSYDCGGSPHVCCMPQPTVSCTGAGGECTFISDCDATKGHLGAAKYSCGAGAPGTNVCCFKPSTGCGGVEDFWCCAPNDAAFRPVCNDGKLECGPGLSKSQKCG